MENNSPFFVLIGTYRSGTTFVQKVLEKNHQIFLPKEKELFFFSRYYDRGKKWYLNFYKKNTGCKVSGEICPSYLRNAEIVAKRIKEFNENTKIIAILRNPYEQIESMLRLHNNRYNNVKITNDIIEKEFLPNVLYYEKLKIFYNYFDKKNIMILDYSELKDSPREFIKKIYHFISLTHVDYEMPQSVNSANKPKFKFIERIIAKTGEFLRDKNLFFVRSIIMKTNLVQKVKLLNTSSDVDFIKLSKEHKTFIRSQLISDYKKLDKFLNIKFSNYL